MPSARTTLEVDTPTAVAIVFGIITVILAISSIYIAFKQLQLATFHVQPQLDVGRSTNNVPRLGLTTQRSAFWATSRNREVIPARQTQATTAAPEGCQV